MRTLTIKNISEDLYAQLGKAAKANRRSLNQQAIYELERSLVRGDEGNVEQELAELDEFRARLGFVAHEAEINAFKREGRA